LTGPPARIRIKKHQKKSRADALLKNCVDPCFLASLDLILIDEATLLVRVRVPPETWTTKLEPLGQLEPEFVDHLLWLVTFFVTIVQNSSTLRNERKFAIPDCGTISDATGHDLDFRPPE
jgi:hypothetical protein